MILNNLRLLNDKIIKVKFIGILNICSDFVEVIKTINLTSKIF